MIQAHRGPHLTAFLTQGHNGSYPLIFPGFRNAFLEIPVYLDPLDLIDVIMHAVLAEFWRCPFHGRQAPFSGNGQKRPAHFTVGAQGDSRWAMAIVDAFIFQVSFSLVSWLVRTYSSY